MLQGDNKSENNAHTPFFMPLDVLLPVDVRYGRTAVESLESSLIIKISILKEAGYQTPADIKWLSPYKTKMSKSGTFCRARQLTANLSRTMYL